MLYCSDKQGFKLILICDDQRQRITANNLVSASAESYLLCAPPPMMHALEKHLKRLGVPKDSIYYEDFALT